MRNLLLSLSLLLQGFGLNAQHCYTTERQHKWFAEHPELKAGFDTHKQESADLDKELFKNGYKIAGKSAAGNYTIPVVFHILHKGGGENISDAQVIDAVNILTRDFNAANADTSNVVGVFKHFIGNTQIDFKLATKDPNGNCTNGIIRHYDANTDWIGDFQDYAYTWPPTNYLNIYVVRTIDGGAAGYTYLPGSGIPASMDAIVILNGYVGSIGSGNVFTSRALTHEVGHWLDLDHVWGGTNNPGVSCGDDGVSDTPVTKGYTSCNLTNGALCTPGVAENVQNYMEYAYCQRMYTIGQSSRMQTCLNGAVNGRNHLSSPANLISTGITSPGTNCIPALDLVALPSFTGCSGRTLSVVSVTYNAIPSSYQWSADNAAVIVNPTLSTVSVVLTNTGVTHVSCQVSNSNGSNSQTISLVVNNGITQITSYHSESFEGSSVAPPATWKRFSANPSEKWEMMQNAASDGAVSLYAPGETLTPSSTIILESPSFDFKHNPGAQFTFKYAYAMYSLNNQDIFKVQASKNCGSTWTDVWVPTNFNLSQNSGGVSSTLYYPTSDEWKLKNVTQQPQFYPFTTEENVLIRFSFQENVGIYPGGNRFYLDEVNFTSPVGINELSKAVEFNVYPNPASAEFNVSFRLSDASRVSYQVNLVTGAVLVSEDEKIYTAGAHEIHLNTHSELAPGIYFMQLLLNGVKMSHKIVIE